MSFERLVSIDPTTLTIGAGLVMLSGLVGCAEDAEIAPVEPTLDHVQTVVFDQACADGGCHSAEVAAGGLDLSHADASYEALVEVPAFNEVAYENGWELVAPGDPAKSFLCRKLKQPGLGEGAPMPPGDHKLHDEYIELVEAWVRGGAER